MISPESWLRDRLDPVSHEPETEPPARPPKLLIVDDEAPIRAILLRHLGRLGYECQEAGSGVEALEAAAKSGFDAVLTDLRMPEMDGIELLGRLKKLDDKLAVVMITANQETSDAIRAMKLGADDYILKPFRFDEVTVGVARALEKRGLKLQILQYQTNLENMVVRRTSQLQSLFVNMIHSLVFSLEAKDPYTDGHSRRVAWMAVQLGRAAGLTARELEVVQVGGMFHDLGKIGIREEVLHKAGALTEEEYAHVKTHPEIAVHILRPLQELKDILPVVLHHHERYDGRGYPTGARADEIPLGSLVVSVVDAYDAMTSSRPYRAALIHAEAVRRLADAAGSQFHANLVELFLPLAEKEEFQRTIGSPEWTSKNPAASEPASDDGSGDIPSPTHYCEL